MCIRDSFRIKSATIAQVSKKLEASLPVGESVYTPRPNTEAKGGSQRAGSSAERQTRERGKESDHRRQQHHDAQSTNGNSSENNMRCSVGSQVFLNRDHGAATVTHKNSLSVLYCNAQSILNKLDELKMLISIRQPDIIGITESWANSTVLDAELMIPGFNLFRCLTVTSE